MNTEKRPASLDDVQRQFEKTRDKIREVEQRARHEIPRRPPGGSDPGSAPPAHPTKHR
jgi:hypothetical protein